MELIVNGDVQDGPVSAERIERAIRSLTGDGDSFAILAKSELSYIQTSGSPSVGFVLEYQDGSIEEHYSCTSHDLDVKQVLDAFQRFFAGDARWRTDLEWVKQDLGSAPSGSPVSKPALFIAAILIIALVTWLYSNGT